MADDVTFTPENLAQMRKVQGRLVDTLLPFRQHTESALMVFALIRCARALVRLYPKGTRDMLIRLMCDYLQGRRTPADVRDHEAPDPAARLIH